MPQRQLQSNQLIRPTTPTSAGFAQVFDTSGIARMQQQKKAMKDKKLQDLLIEYDTKGVWKRDIPHLQNQIQEFQDFTMNNTEALSNPAKNLELYKEWQGMQGEIKNTITYSIAAKEQHKQGTQLYMNGAGGRYALEANQDILFKQAETPTAEQYADRTAWADPSKSFVRGIDLNDSKYDKVAIGLLQDTPPELEGQLVEGTAIISKGKHVDRETVKEALRGSFEAQSLEGGDLNHKYGKGEDGLNAFTDDVMTRVNMSPEYGTARTPTAAEAKKATAAERKAQYAVVTRTGSGYSSIETKVDPVSGKVAKGWVDEQGKKHDAIQTWGVGTVGGADNVMMFQPDLRIVKNITEAQDMTTGKMVQPGEAKRMKYQIPLERATYMVANKRIEYTYTDEDGKKVKNVFDEGEAVPDFDKMLRDGSITKNQHRDLTAKVSSKDGYMVYASNEQVDYFDLAQGEDIMNMLEGKGGRIMMVPAYTIDPEVDQQLLYKHGTTRADYMPAPRAKHNVMEGI